MENKVVVYYRISTSKQERSGLGLEAQKETVMRYLNTSGPHAIVGSYTEIKSGKSDTNRVELQKALRDCKLKNARLIVSKLDRLSRDVEFIAALQKSKIRFTIAEMPAADELTINILAAMAMHERKLISQRTREAFAPLKGTGKLGSLTLRRGERIPGSGGSINAAKATVAKKTKADEFAKDIPQVIQEMGGGSLREIADGLNNSGFTTRKDKKWTAMAVKRVMDRTSEPEVPNTEKTCRVGREMTKRGYHIVELNQVTAQDSTIRFTGKCTRNWRDYFEFSVSEQETWLNPIDVFPGGFRSYDHMAGVFGKFNPYIQLFAKPPRSVLTFDALKTIKAGLSAPRN
jgi:DNA invertase Pin-like site-specific DNA recombinase